MATCTYPDCGRPILHGAWCRAHYRQSRTGRPMHPIGWRPPRPTCTIPGCGRPHRARGLCVSHYETARRAGDFETRETGRPVDEVVAEVNALIGSDSVRGIAERLGYRDRRGKPEQTLYRVLHRAGEDDLWRRLRELEAA